MPEVIIETTKTVRLSKGESFHLNGLLMRYSTMATGPVRIGIGVDVEEFVADMVREAYRLGRADS